MVAAGPGRRYHQPRSSSTSRKAGTPPSTATDTLSRAPEGQTDSKSITLVDPEASSVTSTTCMESRFVGLLFYHLYFGPPFSGGIQFLSKCICKRIYFTPSKMSKL